MFFFPNAASVPEQRQKWQKYYEEAHFKPDFSPLEITIL